MEAFSYQYFVMYLKMNEPLTIGIEILYIMYTLYTIQTDCNCTYESEV